MKRSRRWLRENLAATDLHELLSLDKETGELVWKERDRRWFRSDRDWKAWNTLYAGKSALSVKVRAGTCEYYSGTLLGCPIHAHVVIVAMLTNRWPEGDVDHDDGDGLNNRPNNLFEVTHQQNLKNSRLRKNNTSGETNVFYVPEFSNWRAAIKVDGKRKHLGCFPTKEEAVAARDAAYKRYGFHPNHGTVRKQPE